MTQCVVMLFRESAEFTCGIELFVGFVRNSMKLTKSIQHYPSSDADSSSATHEIPAFYGTAPFIPVFTTACHLSYIEPGQCSLAQNPIPVTYSLILKFHLRLGLPSGCFPIVLHVPRAPSLSPFLFHHAKFLLNITSHERLHYAIISSFLSVSCF